MRRTMFVTAVSLMFLTISCSDEPLTGVEAQAAYAEAVGQWQGLPEEPLVFVDGVLITNEAVLEVAAEEIERIEVLKGTAAERRYGEAAVHGVIHIFTKRGADSVEAAGRP